MSEMLDAALAYRSRGFTVIPQAAKAKKPHVGWKQWQDATPTAATMRGWWLRWPNAGIAAILGPTSNLFAIDVDGTEAHDALVAKLGAVPLAPKSISGSGEPNRYHLFFRHPAITTKAKATPWHPNLEFRGHRGIIIMPPSVHKSGNRYCWAGGLSLDDLDPPDLPRAVLDALTPAPAQREQRAAPSVSVGTGRGYYAKTLAGVCDELRSTHDGNRNTELNNCACRIGHYVPAHLDEEHVRSELLSAALDAGLAEGESLATISSGLAKGMSEPKDKPPPRTGRPSSNGEASPKSRAKAEEPPSATGPEPADADSNGNRPPGDILARVRAIAAVGGEDAILADDDLLTELAALQRSDERTWLRVKNLIKNHKPKISIEAVEKAIKAVCPPDPSKGKSAAHPCGYLEDDGRLYLVRETKEGEAENRLLAHFTARITESVVVDDGDTRVTNYAVEGKLDNGQALPLVEIPADEFPAMGWTHTKWGANAVIEPGRGVSDFVRAGIQQLSRPIPHREAFAHTGWREIDGVWVFLHAGGAIGPHGEVPAVSVTLKGRHKHFLLPPPPERAALRSAVAASLALAEIGPPEILYPLLAAVYRAPLGGVDVSLHLVGDSGAYKTSLAAIFQQHYGAEMQATGTSQPALPEEWSSTAYSILTTLHHLKDVVAVVDEFKFDNANRVHMYGKADMVFRSAANGSGRGRLDSNGVQRITKHPRGLVLSTGEEMPAGLSLRARLMSLKMTKGDIGLEKLRLPQRQGRDGVFSSAMSAYVRWLASDYAAVRDGLCDRIDDERESAMRPGQHGRTPGLVAQLVVGLYYFLDFALASDAITRREYDSHRLEGYGGILRSAEAQTKFIAQEDPAGQFLGLIHSGMACSRIHLVAQAAGSPPDASRWGWETPFIPGGDCVGMVEGDQVFLDPNAAYGAAQKLAKEQGGELKASLETLYSQLRAKRHLLKCDEGRNTVRKTFRGMHRPMLHVRWEGPPSKEDDEG